MVYNNKKGGAGMFGYVMANTGELRKESKIRYGAVYCGICRQIRECASNLARLGLSYDMAFLSLSDFLPVLFVG